jgi:hypothetical protein
MFQSASQGQDGGGWMGMKVKSIPGRENLMDKAQIHLGGGYE